MWSCGHVLMWTCQQVHLWGRACVNRWTCGHYKPKQQLGLDSRSSCHSWCLLPSFYQKKTTIAPLPPWVVLYFLRSDIKELLDFYSALYIWFFRLGNFRWTIHRICLNISFFSFLPTSFKGLEWTRCWLNTEQRTCDPSFSTEYVKHARSTPRLAYHHSAIGTSGNWGSSYVN